jgi:hypothetical protein
LTFDNISKFDREAVRVAIVLVLRVEADIEEVVGSRQFDASNYGEGGKTRTAGRDLGEPAEGGNVESVELGREDRRSRIARDDTIAAVNTLRIVDLMRHA